MKKIDRLIEKAQEYTPLDDRILVHPLKLREYTVTDTVLDEEANKGLNPMVDELKTKSKVVNINYAYQLATVLAVSNNIKDINIGDTVVYRLSNMIEFDLIKGVSILKRYEVIAIRQPEVKK